MIVYAHDLNYDVFLHLLTTTIKSIDKKKNVINILNNINSTEFDEYYDNLTFIKTNLLV